MSVYSITFYIEAPSDEEAFDMAFQVQLAQGDNWKPNLVAREVTNTDEAQLEKLGLPPGREFLVTWASD